MRIFALPLTAGEYFKVVRVYIIHNVMASLLFSLAKIFIPIL